MRGKGAQWRGSEAIWYFTVPLTDELDEQYIRALGLTEDLLLGRMPNDVRKKQDQKLLGETQ